MADDKTVLGTTGEVPKEKHTTLEHLKAKTLKKGLGFRFTFAEIDRQNSPPIKLQFEGRVKKNKLKRLGESRRPRGSSGRTMAYAGFKIRF